jgi:CRISPR/Cas system CSM-associated protein Csm5 (group 7 of RAMP superfamily)
MDEKLVEGKGGFGGCWMEQSIIIIMWKWKKVGKHNKHIHPSIHPFTQLGC